MHFTVEKRFQVPLDTPQKLVDDIETYSAFVDLQARMSGTAYWYQKLA